MDVEVFKEVVSLVEEAQECRRSEEILVFYIYAGNSAWIKCYKHTNFIPPMPVLFLFL